MFDPEKSTRPSGAGQAIAVTAVAVIIVVAAIVAFVVLNKYSAPVNGQITSLKLYLPEAAKPANPDEPEEGVPAGNKMLVLAEVTVHNVGKKPLTVQDFSGVIKSGDTDFQSFAAGSSDVDKIFQYYPDLASQPKNQFPRHVTLAPGATQQGLVIFNYDFDENRWNQAQGFNIEVSFEETKETLDLKPMNFPAHERIPNVTPPQGKLKLQ